MTQGDITQLGLTEDYVKTLEPQVPVKIIGDAKQKLATRLRRMLDPMLKEWKQIETDVHANHQCD